MSGFRYLRPALFGVAAGGFLIDGLFSMLDGDPSTLGLPSVACALACSAIMEIGFLRANSPAGSR